MTRAPHRMAAIEGASGASAQALLADAAVRWRNSGIRVVGLIAEEHSLPDRTCAAGFLRDIVSGARHSIYLAEPPRDTSCHLDASGAEKAAAALIGQIAACDLVVLSKFGKLEASGGGLVPAFTAAQAAGKPVLTAVSSLHCAAWRAFAPGAVALPPAAGALDDWWVSH
ncbi:MAG TPA: DUF2478 domain-containing protein [Hyphomicrobiaceae bacterium]|nr:DUF2478 domain-containing protein [Hyphomicrobiaceae bacterium]